MSTYKELVYMCLDEVKLFSDDAVYTEDHVIFLLGKYRSFLLKQRYSDVKKQIPDSNYQTICLNLIEVPSPSGDPCSSTYLRSREKVPSLMKIGNPIIYPVDYYQGYITLVSKERMRFVGYNKYMSNIIYASIGPDDYVYFKSSNPQHLYLEQVRLTGVFGDAEKASELECQEGGIECDILDREFPLEGSLVPPLIELVVKELLGAEYRPGDKTNDSKDNLAEVTIKK